MVTFEETSNFLKRKASCKRKKFLFLGPKLLYLSSNIKKLLSYFKLMILSLSKMRSFFQN